MSNPSSVAPDLELDGDNKSADRSPTAPIGGKLPYCLELPTSKVLDVIIELSPKLRDLTASQKKAYGGFN